MLHLHFAFYLLSLCTGVVILLQLNQTSPYCQQANFPRFIRVQWLITAFVTVSTLCLYMVVNVPELIWIKSLYLSVILLFITCLPYFSLQESAGASRANLIYRLALTYLLLIGLGVAVAFWWLPEIWRVWSIYSGIVLMLICLTINTGMLGQFSRLNATSDCWSILAVNTKNRISSLMFIQSLLLTGIEVIWFQQALMGSGFTFSLPLIYLINSMLIWRYKDELLLDKSANSPSDLTNQVESESHENNDFSAVLALSDKLTSKEKQIVLSVQQGLSNKAIAAQLAISINTVKNHLYNAYKKYAVTNRTALVHAIQTDHNEQSKAEKLIAFNTESKNKTHS